MAAIKTVHTLAWASIEACVLYVLHAGFAGRTDKRVGIAAVVVVGESLVFAANGFSARSPSWPNATAPNAAR
ncbi:MAG: hypothetical protein WCG47_32575 [Dermatophilaceae bacterium]